MKIQNTTYALCMAATANAVRLQTSTQVETSTELEAQNFWDWLDENTDTIMDVTGLDTLVEYAEDLYPVKRTQLAQVQTSTQLEAQNFWDWLDERSDALETAAEISLLGASAFVPLGPVAVAGLLYHNREEEEEEPMPSPEEMIVLVRIGAMTLDEVSSILDDRDDITDEQKEFILRYVSASVENTVNDGDSQPTQLAQVETKAELQTQNFWDWLDEHSDTIMDVADIWIPGIEYVIPVVEEVAERNGLINFIQENPTLAVPGVVAAVNSGDLNLDDYDIPSDAKEEIKRLADSIATI